MNQVKTKLTVTSLMALISMSVFPYCIQHEDDRPDFDPGPIPVYVQTSGIHNIREIGIQTDEGEDSNNYEIEVKWIRAAIEIINSASTAVPPLYYAGINNGLGFNYSFNDMDPGITITSWICQSQPNNSIAVQTSNANKSLIRFNKGGSQSCSNSCDWENQPSDCFAWYVDPDQRETLGADNDFLGVLVHELVHSLGLGHSNENEGVWNANCSNPYQADVGASVMNTSYQQDWRHSLRRDDIEGLREIWGKPNRAIYTQSLDTEFVGQSLRKAWKEPIKLGRRMITNTPAALSGSATNDSEQLLGGFTYHKNDRFRYFTGDWAGWDIGPITKGYKVPSDLGQVIKSFQMVSVSAGEPEIGFDGGHHRKLFAWVGGEDTASEMTDDNQVRIRWRVKKGDNWLNSSATPKTHYTNFSSAYDPGTDRFLVAYIDNSGANIPENQYLHVQTINGWNGEASCTTIIDFLPGLHPYQIGDMSCDYKNNNTATSCVIPVSDLSNEGPELQYIQGKIGPLQNPSQQVNSMCFELDGDKPLWSFGQNVIALPSSTQSEVFSFGHMGTAMRGFDMIGNPSPWSLWTPGYSDLLISHKDEFNIDGAYHTFVIERNAFGLYESIGLESELQTDFWPLRLGSMSSSSNTINRAKWKAITY